MKSRRGWILVRQGIASAPSRLATVLAAAGLLATACAGPDGAPRDPVEAPAPPQPVLLQLFGSSEPPPGAVVVRLAFGAEADFDLYVTGPLEETVYFANTPSQIGGRLLRDLRCDAPGPRLETVVFEAGLPGRYRVGVDLPERCDGARGTAPYVVEIRAPGVREVRSGELAPGTFEAVVFEWTAGG